MLQLRAEPDAFAPSSVALQWHDGLLRTRRVVRAGRPHDYGNDLRESLLNVHDMFLNGGEVWQYVRFEVAHAKTPRWSQR